MNECKDENCPNHGSISVRGRNFIGVVISTKMAKTVSVEWGTMRYLPKYERYEKRRSRVKAHLPECMVIVPGDKVKVGECRPLSKTKKFVVIEKIGREKLFEEKKELMEESKKKEKPKKIEEEREETHESG